MTTSAFHEHVLQRREVCANCFRQIREVDPAPGDDYWREHGARTHNGWSDGTLMEIATGETVAVTDDGRFCWTAPVLDRLSRLPERRGGGRVVCRVCGRIDGGFETKSKGDLREALARACDRVVEADAFDGVLDRDAVFSHFERVAAEPDRQHDQLGILAECIQVGWLVAASGGSSAGTA